MKNNEIKFLKDFFHKNKEDGRGAAIFELAKRIDHFLFRVVSTGYLENPVFKKSFKLFGAFFDIELHKELIDLLEKEAGQEIVKDEKWTMQKAAQEMLIVANSIMHNNRDFDIDAAPSKIRKEFLENIRAKGGIEFNAEILSVLDIGKVDFSKLFISTYKVKKTVKCPICEVRKTKIENLLVHIINCHTSLNKNAKRGNRDKSKIEPASFFRFVIKSTIQTNEKMGFWISYPSIIALRKFGNKNLLKIDDEVVVREIKEIVDSEDIFIRSKRIKGSAHSNFK